MARRELKPSTRTRCFILLPLFLLVMMAASTAFCDEEIPSSAELEEDAQDFPKEELKPLTSVSVQAGYRFVTPDGPTAAASPYGRLKSGATGGFSASTLGSDLKLSVDGMFLNEDDYHTELFFDQAGMVHIHAKSEALWHNLLREQINPGLFTLVEQDTGRVYGVRNITNQADTRIKLGNNPFHINLGYWELKRDGYQQARFSDDFFDPATGSVISAANRVDSITREGTMGIDAHLGPLDISYGFRIRDFSNEAPNQRYDFTNNAFGSLIPGNQAHNVIPDSRVTSHTVKMYSSMSGGLVGSASYNLIQRKNNGGHGDAVPSSKPSDNIQNIAGDLSYTPFKELSLALKYRHQEISRDTPALVFYPYSQIPPPPVPGVYTATPGLLRVRPAEYTVKDTLTFSSIFRPGPKVVYRLEYDVVFESRDNISNQPLDPGSPDALHSDSRQTHTGKASFFWKPYKDLKLNASYSYAVCDNPAYNTSFSDRHNGKLLLTYIRSGKWGLTGSYIVQYDTGAGGTVSAPRESRNHSANASFWFSPLERLTITTNYSYLQSDTDQTISFSEQSPAASLASTNYRSSAHAYGIDATYAVTEQLDLSVAFQQVLSNARFNVQEVSYTIAPEPTHSTAGITDLTRLDTTETGVSLRADWRITAMLGCVLDYSFRMYDSGNPVFDGSVHTTMLSLKSRW